MTGKVIRATRTLIVGLAMTVAAMAGLALLREGILAAHSWESANWPVVRGTTIVETRPAADGRHTDVVVEFDKVRPCRFLHQIWYWRHPTGPWVEAAIEYPEDHGHPPTSKPIGRFAAEWVTDIPWVHRGAVIRIESSHRCYAPFPWVTLTDEYPPRRERLMGAM